MVSVKKQVQNALLLAIIKRRNPFYLIIEDHYELRVILLDMCVFEYWSIINKDLKFDNLNLSICNLSLIESFWDETALAIVNYIISDIQIQSAILHNRISYLIPYGVSSIYNSFCTFGCACFILVHPCKRNKQHLNLRILLFYESYGIK